DRLKLSPYGLSMAGLGFDNVQAVEKRDMVIENLSQYLVEDDENQTAYLKIGASWTWWFWYADEIETQAAYLRLLCRTEPKGARASRLVKYLLNNRRHATYWKSTRDTAYVIEAFAEYLRASGEDTPDMTVVVSIDGKEHKRVKIDAENLFSFDNKLVLSGKDVTTGKHTITVAREGDGPVYFNAYLTNFTLEEAIDKAGLEVKVARNVYKLVPVDKTVKVEGSRGQAVDQTVEKYQRVLIPDAFADGEAPKLASGEMIEVELVVESKNDYEYIVIEDYKAAGTEPVEVRSGRGDNAMGAYMELRDEKVAFFVRRLARGKHSLSYRLFAETPGRFSALPAKAEAMYAPELKANSNEQKLTVTEAAD
ncbi:MAG: alpha-2-macroglobulin, partial [Phycisphaerae bacterium]|nr:alpha-2-macroglobulin [Phycisphaerae bacterium]